MHERATTLWAWQMAATLGLFTSVGLWLRSPLDENEHVAARDHTADEAGASWLQPIGSAARTEHRGATAGLMLASAELEQARNTDERCNAMSRLARRRDLDAVAVDQIANYTESPHPMHARHCAISALGSTDHPAALPTLIALVDAQEQHIADQALRALESWDSQEVRSTLLRVAKGTAAELRLVAIEVLARRRDPETVGLIAELLPNAEGERRHQLVYMLGATRDPRALAPLQALLSGPGHIQHAVIQALGTLGGSPAENTLIDIVHERPALAAAALGALSASNSEHALALLMEVAEGEGEYGEPLVAAALQALTGQSGPEVTALMLRTVAGANPQRTNTAAQYLATHRVASAVPVLLNFLQESGPHQAWPAVYALSQMGDAGREGLEQLALGSSAAALSAGQALSNMAGGREAARRIALAKLSQQKGPQAAQWTHLLADDDSPEAREALLKLARTGDEAVSTQTLHLLGRRSDPETLEAMIDLAKTGQTGAQRAAALASLQQRTDPRAQAQVRAALKDPSLEVRTQAVQGLSSQSPSEWEEGALAASRDSEPQVAQAATYSLVQLGSPRALTRLEELAGSAKPGVSQAALYALLEHTPGRAAKIAEALASSREVEGVLTAVRTLGMLPKGVGTRVLTAALRQDNPEILRETLPMAGSLGLSSQELEALLGPLARNQALPEDVRARVAEVMSGSGGPGMFLGPRAGPR